MPSLREYAARYQVSAGRLRPGQLLMHPGPVNRGVELSADAIDSPQALIGEQVKSGVVGADGRPLRAPRRRPGAPGGGGMSERESGIPVCSPRPAQPRRAADPRRPRRSTPAPRSTPPTTCSSATARSPRSGAPGSLTAPGRRETLDADGLHLFPGFVDPHVHLRTPGQEYKEDLDTGTAAAAAGGFVAVIAMPNTDPVLDDAAVLGSLVTAPRPRGARAHRLPGLDHPRPRRRGPHRDGRAARRRRARLHRRRQARRVGRDAPRALPYQRLCGGVIALHEEDPALSGDGVMHEGAVVGPARARRDPVGVGVDDGRPGRGARALRGRPRPLPAPLLRRVGRGAAPRPRRRRAGRRAR